MGFRFLLTVVALAANIAVASELSDVSNFREYSDTLSSSGQPSAEQLEIAAEQGYQRIVYLAFTDNDTAIEHEDSTVKKLGMEYVHIPIDFMRPAVADFEIFASTMQQQSNSRTLVHCQVNFRASTFSFLYRVIYEDVPMLDAKSDLDGVWSLNETWFRFVRSVLESNGVSKDCDGCDWGEHDFIDDRN